MISIDDFKADLIVRGIILPDAEEPADRALVADLWRATNTYDVMTKRAATRPEEEP